MGAGASVNEEFLNDDYRKRLQVTLQQEIERHGLGKDEATAIVNKVVSEGEALNEKDKKESQKKEAEKKETEKKEAEMKETEKKEAEKKEEPEKTEEKGEKQIIERSGSILNIPIIRGANMFVCAVDGTEAGDLAFGAVKDLIKKKDHICMFHAFNQPTDETRVAMRPDNVKERYANELLSMYGRSRYSFIWEDKRDRNVKDVIANLTSMYGKLAHGACPDFLVMGYTGSKGITKKGGATTAGSVSDFAMRSIHIPIIIIKNEVTPGPKSYVMAVDDSTTSSTGFDILCTLIKPQDSLTLVHVTEVNMDKLGNSTVDTVTSQYEKELNENAPTTNVSFKAILRKEGKSVSTLIQEAVDEIDPDFFALAPRANPDNKITALTEQMIASVKSNIILCKL